MLFNQKLISSWKSDLNCHYMVIQFHHLILNHTVQVIIRMIFHKKHLFLPELKKIGKHLARTWNPHSLFNSLRNCALLINCPLLPQAREFYWLLINWQLNENHLIKGPLRTFCPFLLFALVMTWYAKEQALWKWV